MGVILYSGKHSMCFSVVVFINVGRVIPSITQLEVF